MPVIEPQADELRGAIPVALHLLGSEGCGRLATLDRALVRAAAGRDPLVPRLDGDSQDEPAVQGFRQEPDGYGANLPLLFSDRDFLPSVAHLGLEAA